MSGDLLEARVRVIVAELIARLYEVRRVRSRPSGSPGRRSPTTGSRCTAGESSRNNLATLCAGLDDRIEQWLAWPKTPRDPGATVPELVAVLGVLGPTAAGHGLAR